MNVALSSDLSSPMDQKQQLIRLKQNITCQYYTEPLRSNECIGDYGIGTRTIRFIPLTTQSSHCPVKQEIESCFTLQSQPFSGYKLKSWWIPTWVPFVDTKQQQTDVISAENIVNEDTRCQFELTSICGFKIITLRRRDVHYNVKNCSSFYNALVAIIYFLHDLFTLQPVESPWWSGVFNNFIDYWNSLLKLSALIPIIIMLAILNVIYKVLEWTFIFNILGIVSCCVKFCCKFRFTEGESRPVDNNRGNQNLNMHRHFICCRSLCPTTWDALEAETIHNE